MTTSGQRSDRLVQVANPAQDAIAVSSSRTDHPKTTEPLDVVSVSVPHSDS